MSEEIFSISNLIPKFSVLLEGGWQTADGFSALIVLIILVIAVLFFILSLFQFVKANIRISKLNDLVKGIKPDELFEQRRNILHKAQSYGREVSGLWGEFDESLVVSADEKKLYNSIDASHFFNTHTLASRITENRLLAAVPGFLTAIGVIGTFAGLQLGLANLELSSSAGVDQLRQGISSMISGAAVAFLTSVWGVLSSVVFNFTEKFLERSIRLRISNLQVNIDYIYPRINPDQSLLVIAEKSKESNSTLHGLAEKIGTKMQEAMADATKDMQNALTQTLTQIMQPAIKSLVDNANQGSEKALESLMERFLEGVGDAGNTQKKMMDEASKNVQESTLNMSKQMSDFITQLKATSDESDSSNRDLLKGVSDITEKQGEMTAGALNKHNEIMENYQSLIEEQRNVIGEVKSAAESIGGASSELNSSSDKIKYAADLLGDNVSGAAKAVTELVEQNNQVNSRLLEIMDKYDQVSSAITDATSHLSDAAVHAESGFTAVNEHLESYQEAISEHVNEIESQVTKLLKDYASLTQEQVQHRMNEWNSQTEKFTKTMVDATETIASVVDDIETIQGA